MEKAKVSVHYIKELIANEKIEWKEAEKTTNMVPQLAYTALDMLRDKIAQHFYTKSQFLEIIEDEIDQWEESIKKSGVRKETALDAFSALKLLKRKINE